jgi:hypothetical protein
MVRPASSTRIIFSLPMRYAPVAGLHRRDDKRRALHFGEAQINAAPYIIVGYFLAALAAAIARIGILCFSSVTSIPSPGFRR